MSEERLKEIKDSIDFQVDYMKSINFDNVILNEEKELYDEVIRLNNIINELEKYCEKERATSQFVHECNAYNDVLMKLKELKENKE